MKCWFQVLAALLAVATLSVWLATGANRGWTKTSVAIEKSDDVTGLTYREYEKRFVPGVDFVCLGIGLAVALGAGSLFLKRRSGPDRPAAGAPGPGS